MTPEERRLELLAERIAALNEADAAMRAAMTAPLNDEDEPDEPDDTEPRSKQ